MTEELDSVARYGMALGLAVRPRTVLVEGTSDVDLFQMAAKLERRATGLDLFGSDLAILAAGDRDRGGVHGVIRELIAFRGMARTCLLPNGRPRYRFVGLFDNDGAGRKAVSLARQLDSSIVEFKDVFCLWPTMPLPGSLDPGDVKRTFERENANYKGLDWEIEDLLPSTFTDAFLAEYPFSVQKSIPVHDKCHREFTPDGKARLLRFVKDNAMYNDLHGVIEVLMALRFYLGVK